MERNLGVNVHSGKRGIGGVRGGRGRCSELEFDVQTEAFIEREKYIEPCMLILTG